MDNGQKISDQMYAGVANPNAYLIKDEKHSRKGSPFNTDFEKLRLLRISNKHGRSLQDAPLLNSAIWADEYKVMFCAHDFKGMPIEEPSLKYDTYGTNRIRVTGLKDNHVLTRITRASEVLRKDLKLPTERIVAKYRVEAVPYHGELIRIDDWKKIMSQNARDLRGPNGTFVPAQTVHDYLNSPDTQFCVLERETQIPERIIDLRKINFEIGQDDLEITTSKQTDTPAQADDAEFQIHKTTTETIENIKIKGNKFREHMRKIFRVINVYEEQLGHKWHFDVSNNDDIVNYFQNYLPQNMGTFLGTLHKNGLSHGFASWHNWSAMGNLYDLDSIQGKLLFPTDPDLTNTSRKRDLIMSIRAAIDIHHDSHSIQIDGREPILYSGYLNQISPDQEGMEKTTVINFLTNYILETQNITKGPNINQDIDSAVAGIKEIVGDGIVKAPNNETLGYGIINEVYAQVKEKLKQAVEEEIIENG